MKLFPFQNQVIEQTVKYNRVGYFLDMGLG